MGAMRWQRTIGDLTGMRANEEEQGDHGDTDNGHGDHGHADIGHSQNGDHGDMDCPHIVTVLSP